MKCSDLPIPKANADSAPYWEGAARGKLLLRKCNGCNATHFMPRYMCPKCWSENLEWFEASGHGVIHSYTIIRRASDPAFKAAVPYVTALVELAEGPRMVANIVGDGALESRIGDFVEVVFEKRGDAAVPQFRRA